MVYRITIDGQAKNDILRYNGDFVKMKIFLERERRRTEKVTPFSHCFSPEGYRIGVRLI